MDAREFVGQNSLPLFREILKDESLLKYHDDAIHALAEAGGAAVGSELTVRVLNQELAFWKKLGPGLKAGWWNGPWDATEPLWNHYNRAYATLGR